MVHLDVIVKGTSESLNGRSHSSNLGPGIRTSVQTGMEKIDEIMTNNSRIARLSQEIVYLKETHSGSAGSTVAASSGSGRSTSNFAAHVMPNTFIPNRVELNGWEVWRNISATGITMHEVRNLVSGIGAMNSDTDLNKFNWELTDRDQGNFDSRWWPFCGSMKVSLHMNANVCSWTSSKNPESV